MKSEIIGLNEYSLEHNISATVLSLDEWIKDKEGLVDALSKDNLFCEDQYHALL